MPRPRFDKLDPERREAVIAVAAAELAEHGFHEASTNRVQAALGVSKGAFYYWFDDKEDLFVTAVEARLAELAAVIAPPADPEGPFWEEVERLVRLTLLAVFERPEHLALLQAFVAMPADSPRLQGLWEQVHGWSARFLRGGMAQGAVRDDLPEALLVALVMAVGESLDRFLLTHPEATADGDPERWVRTYVDLFRRMAAPGPTSTEAAPS